MVNLRKLQIVPLLVLALALCASKCEPPPEENPEIIGDASWFDRSSQEQRRFLIDTFQGRGEVNQTLDWPPDQFRKTLHICVDVTGSGYTRWSLYQGRRMPLAEYNLLRLRDEYLLKTLRPGDHIVMRLYGARPSGEDLIIDEHAEIDFPRDRIEVDARNPSRRPGHVQIVVKSVTRVDSALREQVASKLVDWFLTSIRRFGNANERFQASPLLQYIHAICERTLPEVSGSKVYVFVTDGHFNIANLYYDPKTYTQRACSPDRIKNIITDMQIKPFSRVDENVKIVLFGLTTDGVEGFRLAESEILTWFFSPQPIEMSYN